MLSRRGFLAWVSGWVTVRGQGIERQEKGTSVHKRDRPEESVQQLIRQIRFLELNNGRKAHIQAIQDQIRGRLLLSGLACCFTEEDGQGYVCALETRTGVLWCLPIWNAKSPWARQEWRRIGLSGLEDRVRTLPRACDI
jgi:hypothetical protein